MFSLYTISFLFFTPSFFLSFSCFDVNLEILSQSWSQGLKRSLKCQNCFGYWSKVVRDGTCVTATQSPPCLCPQILKPLQTGSLIGEGWEEDTCSEGIVSGWVPIKGRASSSSAPWYIHDLNVYLLDRLESVSQQHLRCCPSYLGIEGQLKETISSNTSMGNCKVLFLLSHFWMSSPSPSPVVHSALAPRVDSGQHWIHGCLQMPSKTWRIMLLVNV